MKNTIRLTIGAFLCWFLANTAFAACTNPIAERESAVSVASTVGAASSDAKVHRKQRKKLVQKMREQLRSYRKAGGSSVSRGICVLIAIFLPFIGVLVYENSVTVNFWISLILSFLFYLPGLIYALLVIFDIV